MDILEMPRDVPYPAPAHIGHSGLNGHAGGVGLWGSGQKDYRLGQRQLGLRQPKLKGIVHTCLDDGHRQRISHAHILAGGAQDAADGGNHIPRFQQPGQIVERRVRVRAPHGLHEG